MSIDLASEFDKFINRKEFCCIGARKALVEKNVHYLVINDTSNQGVEILEFISNFIHQLKVSDNFYSAVIFFQNVKLDSEKSFERFLWGVLRDINKIDTNKKNKWAEGYSNNTNDSNFSFSIAGEPFFIIGLHPESHRISRRFICPTLVFNHHIMFEKLKKTPLFDKYKTAIRKNDIRIQGYINKHSSDFGDASEASQYASVNEDNLFENMIFNKGGNND